jgi:uncharacterized protein (DUF2141 family)
MARSFWRGRSGSLPEEGVGLDSRDHHRRGWLAAVVVTVTLTATGAQETMHFSIAGEITGASGAHAIRVALWNEVGFLQKPVTDLRLDAGTAARYRFVVRPGRWAISAYEDRNENGVLDMGLFGPKEPTGFSRPFRGRHKPHFEDVAIPVDHDITDANILLK